MKDAKLITTKALPAAGASNSHDGIDLGATTGAGQIVPGTISLELACPSVTALVDAKTIIFTIEDSADNSTWTGSTLGISWTITGAGGVGDPGFTKVWRLPTTTRRYVRVTQAVLTAGGTLTAISTTVSVICH